MTTTPMNLNAGQPVRSEGSILGILFFLMGAPHLYGALKRRNRKPKGFRFTPYAAAVLFLGVVAGVVELSVL